MKTKKNDKSKVSNIWNKMYGTSYDFHLRNNQIFGLIEPCGQPSTAFRLKKKKIFEIKCMVPLTVFI